MAVFNHGLPIKANVIQGEGGTDTSKDTVTPDSLREGYTAHDAAGQEITGTIPDYSGGSPVEMTSPDGATLNTAGTYCEGNIEVVPKLQSKTATTGEIVTADEGFLGLESVDTNPVAYNALWDVLQDHGKLTNYNFFLAGKFWTKENFKPKYDIRPASLYMFVFLQSGFGIDMPAVCEECGIVFDTSRCKDFQYGLGSSVFSRLGVIDARGADSLDTQMFSSSPKLQTIEKLIVKETHAFGPYTFSGCSGLTTLNIEGTIGQGGLNLSWSPLSKASLTSIINALSTTTTGLTVTLCLDAVNTAFETTAGAADGSTSEEWTALIATKPNWTINLINS